MTLNYINQNESVKELRVWAKQKGYIMRKCNVLLAGNRAYKLYDKVSGEAVSNYFTLYDITQINNYCGEGFEYLIV